MSTDSDGSLATSGRISHRELLLMLSAIMALMALGIDLMLPAFDDIREAFGLDPDSTRVSLLITTFFLGLAVAQIVWGPLADRFGRKPILYAGIGIYVLSAVACAVAPSFNWLLVARFMWGVGAAGSRVVATAIIRDTFSGTRMAKAMSQIMAVFVMAPIFAPALGAGLIGIFPWQSVFWFCAIWSTAIAVWTLRLPETLDPQHRRALEFRSVAGGFRQVARTRITSGYTLATLGIQGVFTAYVGSSERIISEIFDRQAQFPFIFGAIGVLFGVGAILNGQLVERFGIRQLIHAALYVAIALGALLVIVSVAAEGQPSFWIFMPLLGLLLSTFMFLMPNLNTAALTPLGALAGTASSLTGAVRTAGGAVLGAIVDTQVDDSTTFFAIAALVFIAAAGGCIVWAEIGSTEATVD